MRPDVVIDINALADAGARPHRARTATACGSARWCAWPMPPTHPDIRRDYPGDRAVARARRERSSCATWRASAATCCSARAAPISATCRMRPATSASRGSGCAALDGVNRMHAVLGVSDHCIATYPGDFAPGPDRARRDGRDRRRRAAARTIPFAALHRQPGDTPDIETTLQPGELITVFQRPGRRRGRGARSI